MKLFRSRRSRALVSGVAALVLAAGVAGCSASSSGTTITFYSWDNESQMKPIVTAFEKANPDIKVDISYGSPVEGYITTLQTRLNSGTAADVFIITAENKAELMHNGLAADLSDQAWTSNLADSAKAAYTYKGKLYGAATSSWGGGIVYNEDLLAKVGFTSPPKTWNEFIALEQKLKDAGITPFLETAQELPESLAALIGIQNSELGGNMDQQIWDGKTTFAKTWTKPLTLWDEMFTKGLVSKDVTGLSIEQVTAEFAKGDVAMMATGSWGLGATKAAAPNVKFKYMAVPGESTTYWAGAVSPGYAVNAKTQHKDAALTFVKYLQSAAAVKVYQKETGSITTTKDFTPTLDPALADMVQPVREGKIYLPQVAWPDNSAAMNTEATALVQQMIAGQLTPSQVAQGLDKKLASLRG